MDAPCSIQTPPYWTQQNNSTEKLPQFVTYALVDSATKCRTYQVFTLHSALIHHVFLKSQFHTCTLDMGYSRLLWLLFSWFVSFYFSVQFLEFHWQAPAHVFFFEFRHFDLVVLCARTYHVTIYIVCLTKKKYICEKSNSSCGLLSHNLTIIYLTNWEKMYKSITCPTNTCIHSWII